MRGIGKKLALCLFDAVGGQHQGHQPRVGVAGKKPFDLQAILFMEQ